MAKADKCHLHHINSLTDSLPRSARGEPAVHKSPEPTAVIRPTAYACYVGRNLSPVRRVTPAPNICPAITGR